MRYLARRLTGDRAWLHMDLPLTDVERTRTLSGPGGLNGSIKPELREVKGPDGKRLLSPWGTIIYAVDDEAPGSPIVGHGIVQPVTSWTAEGTALQCAGISAYAHGMKYEGERLWGPAAAFEGTPAKPRPDPLVIAQDLWAHLQAGHNSNLGVTLTGKLSSSVRIGDNENPYRLMYWEAPDIGEEFDRLAGDTPFDYVEEVYWANAQQTEVAHTIRLGWPRLGSRRHDLRFATGENIVDVVEGASPGVYANDVFGIGNGEGRTMKMSRSSVDDGNLRRMTTVTDKTLSQWPLNRLTVQVRERLMRDIDIESITVKEHPNAPLQRIQPGDDIRVQAYITGYGDYDAWSRVLTITEGGEPDEAVLGLRTIGAFLYTSTAEVEQW